MLHIVRDGLRRWWWVYAIAGVGSVFSVLAHNRPSVIMLMAVTILYSAIMLFVFEVSTPAKFRSINMLPVSRRRIGLAFGLLWAGLVPLFHITVYLANGLVHLVAPQLTSANIPLTLYGPVWLFSVGMSCFFLLTFQCSQYFPQGWRKMLWDFSSSFFMILMLCFVGYFVYRFELPANSPPLPHDNQFAAIVNRITGLLGPKTSELDIPSLAVLGVSAASIIFFILWSNNFARYVLSTNVKQTEVDLPFFSGKPKRTYGFFEPWVQEFRDGTRVISVLSVACAGLYILLWLIESTPNHKEMSAIDWPLVLIIITGLVCVPPMFPWIIVIRTLRVLPFSRKRLTRYLISFPLLAFLVYSAVLFVVCTCFHTVEYALSMEWWMVLVFGLSLISVSMMLQARHTLTAAFFLFLPTILTAILAKKSHDPVVLMQESSFLLKAVIGIVLITAGYLLLYAVIARNGPYRSKPWIGSAER